MLRQVDWAALFSRCKSVDEKVCAFNKVIVRLRDIHFPEKKIRRRHNEPLWFTEYCRELWKKENKIYSREGNTVQYKYHYSKFEKALNCAKDTFFNKELDNGCIADPKRWHKSIHKLASNGCVKSAGPPVVAQLEGSDSAKADVTADSIEAKTASYPPLMSIK